MTMSKNTSVSLGQYFDGFVHELIDTGRYKNVSEVIRAGLRLLEEEEIKVRSLRKAIDEGIASGSDKGFNPRENLQKLKDGRKKKDG